MDEDRGARRNRNEHGLWLINALLSALVILLSVYVFRTPDAPTDVSLQVAAHQTRGY